MYALLTVKGDS